MIYQDCFLYTTMTIPNIQNGYDNRGKNLVYMSHRRYTIIEPVFHIFHVQYSQIASRTDTDNDLLFHTKACQMSDNGIIRR